MRRTNRKSAGLLLSLALFLITIPTGCGTVAEESHAEENHAGSTSPSLGLDEETVRTADIQVEEARSIQIEDYLETTGVVFANDSRLAHIRPLSRGVVETVHVTLGSRVSGGQPLIRYDIIELGELISEYLSRQAALRVSLTH